MSGAPKPLRAFYGARGTEERATASTVRVLVGQGERPQEICTPFEILDPLRDAWGSIELDPCGHDDSFVDARETWIGEPIVIERPNKSPIVRWGGPGLQRPWRDRTFWNPPYRDLRAWFAHAREQQCEWINLIPVRTHRRWWRALAREVDGILWLDPLKFLGYVQAFPAPLAMMYRGQDTAVIEALSHLGDWSGPL